MFSQRLNFAPPRSYRLLAGVMYKEHMVTVVVSRYESDPKCGAHVDVALYRCGADAPRMMGLRTRICEPIATVCEPIDDSL